jgi:hypothetical protein
VTLGVARGHSGFAGDDIDVARFYPEDDRFLADRDLTVKHYDVVG